MLIETRLTGASSGEQAARQEQQGYCGTFSTEHNNDPFLPLVAAAASTSRLEVGTAVAIAFARSPMTLAYTAHHLQALSEGRFVLGLGTQVRAHIERRFSMGWDAPVARMREYLTALRAIWGSWRTGEPLAHSGRFYTHTLMPPPFVPASHEYSDPLVLLAAVGPAMTRLACEQADGVILHPFASSDFLHAVTLPLLREAVRANGRSFEKFRVSTSVLVATGCSEEELFRSIEALRARIAFYGSTPAYRPALTHHGWDDLAERLHELSLSSDPARWDDMTRLVPDEAVRTIGVVGEPHEVAGLVRERYRGVVDRICLTAPSSSGTVALEEAVAQLALADRR